MGCLCCCSWWRWRGPVTGCPRSNRSGWMSCRNWGLTWRCVTWRLLEPEELVWNKQTKKNWLTLLLIYRSVAKMKTSAGRISAKNYLSAFPDSSHWNRCWCLSQKFNLSSVFHSFNPIWEWGITWQGVSFVTCGVIARETRKRRIMRWRSSVRTARIRNSLLTDNQSWCMTGSNNHAELMVFPFLWQHYILRILGLPSNEKSHLVGCLWIVWQLYEFVMQVIIVIICL